MQVEVASGARNEAADFCAYVCVCMSRVAFVHTFEVRTTNVGLVFYVAVGSWCVGVCVCVRTRGEASKHRACPLRSGKVDFSADNAYF